MKRTAGAIERVTVKPETHRDLNAFRTALGLTQDGVIKWLLKTVVQDGETPYDAGDRLFKEWMDEQHNQPEDVPL